MKIIEILDEAAGEWTKHPTRPGVLVKNPKWVPPAKKPRVKSGLNRSEAMKARHAATTEKLHKLHMYIVRAVGETFPDGDPADMVVPYARKLFGLDEWADPWKYINAAVRKNEGYSDLSTWLAEMWDQYADDAMYDAKNGYIDDNSVFYRVGPNGEIEREGNPWR